MASPSARTGLLLGSTNDIRLAPPACSTAPKRPRIDVSLAQRGPWSPGRHVPRKVAILLPREVGILSPLGYIPKWPFGAFAMQSRCPTHPARPPSHVGGPHCAPRPSFCDVGWLPRSTTARVPPCPTRLHPWDHGCKLFALAPTGHGLRRRASQPPDVPDRPPCCGAACGTADIDGGNGGGRAKAAPSPPRGGISAHGHLQVPLHDPPPSRREDVPGRSSEGCRQICPFSVHRRDRCRYNLRRQRCGGGMGCFTPRIYRFYPQKRVCTRYDTL
jgi:hypothetical protein